MHRDCTHSRGARPHHLVRTLIVAILTALGAAASAAPAQADTLDDWNAAAIDFALAAVPTGAGLPIPAATTPLATVHAAMYDAATAIDRRYEPYHAHIKAPRGASMDAAIAAAARDTLVGYFPALTGAIDARYAASLAQIADGQAKTDGIAVGQQAAASLLAFRAGDGYGVDQPEYYVAPPVGPGVWVPLAGRGVYPWIGHVRPFVVDAPDQFLPHPPAPLTSERYAREYNEVKDYGRVDSAVRTPEQTNLALFFTAPVPRQYGLLARELGARFHIDTADRARLYAQMNVAGADAVIGCWYAKYHYLWWRPQAAITTTFDDGNPATAPDTTWAPLRAAPNYADHPSGHACYTAATMATFRHFFGTDHLSFTLTHVGTMENPSTGLTDPTLEFDRFSDVNRAVQSARVFLGIHFRSAQIAGARLGRKTARVVAKQSFQPVECLHCHESCGDDERD